MNFLPQAIEWLETSVKSKSPSSAKVYAGAILDEIKRLGAAVDTLSEALERCEGLRESEMAAHRTLEDALWKFEKEVRIQRDAWDAERADLEARLSAAMKGEV